MMLNRLVAEENDKEAAWFPMVVFDTKELPGVPGRKW